MELRDKQIQEIIAYRELLKDVEKKQAIDDVKQQAQTDNLDLSTAVLPPEKGLVLNGEFKYLYLDDENSGVEPKAKILVRFTDQQSTTSKLIPMYAGERLYAGDHAIWMKVEIFNFAQNKTVKIVRSLTDIQRQNLVRVAGSVPVINQSLDLAFDNLLINVLPATVTTIFPSRLGFLQARAAIGQNVSGSPMFVGSDNPSTSVITAGFEVKNKDFFYWNVLTPLYIYSFVGGDVKIQETGKAI